MKSLLSSLGKFAPFNGHWYIEGSRAHLVFLALALIFGLSFLVVTPPFQVPDETNHFLKAYQVYTGQLMGVKEMGRRSSHQGMPKSFTSLNLNHISLRKLAGITFSYTMFLRTCEQ